VGTGGTAGSSSGSTGADELAELMAAHTGAVLSQLVTALSDTEGSQVVLAHSSTGTQALLAFTDILPVANGIEIASMNANTYAIGAPVRVAKAFAGPSQLAAAASGDTFLLAYTADKQIELVSVIGGNATTMSLSTPKGASNVTVAGGSTTFLVCWAVATDATLVCSTRNLDGSAYSASVPFTAAVAKVAPDSISIAYVPSTFAVMYHDATAHAIGVATVAEDALKSDDLGLAFSPYAAVAIAARDVDFVYILTNQGPTLFGGTMQTDGTLSMPGSIGAAVGQAIYDPALSCDVKYCAACWYAIGTGGNTIGCGQMDTNLVFSLGSIESVYSVYGASAALPFQPALLQLDEMVLVLPPPGAL
jgi:hypothetical protein